MLFAVVAAVAETHKVAPNQHGKLLYNTIIHLSTNKLKSDKMKKPNYHILVCNSFRLSGEAQGACNKKGASSLLQYIMEECNDRGLDVAVSTTGCLNLCSQGPVIVVHPNNFWYGCVETEEAIDEILDALEEGEACEKYLISE